MKHYRNKFFALTLSLAFTASHLSIPCAFSAEANEIESAETSVSKTPVAAPKWASEVEVKYKLTDAQMKTFTDAGFKGPQLAIAAELAKESGKTPEEIVKMRTTDKMGWGKIAKTLGLPASSIGQAVSSMHHDLNDKRHEQREEKKKDKEEKKEEKNDEKKEERKERREERRKDHKADQAEHASHPGVSH